MKNKILIVLLVAALAIALCSCGSDVTKKVVSDETWTIYWYLCGSDLESNYGSATADLLEATAAEMSENVKIYIQTGGTSKWNNNTVDENYSERYCLSVNGLELLEQNEIVNMADGDTLEDFLRFGAENFPADKNAVFFWDHGGGSSGGVAYDELFPGDYLSLGEMYQAFSSVFELSEDNPPFEAVGFDTCLMATIDAAYTYNDIAKYMIASEELMPGNGWYYTPWIEALCNNPTMNGGELGEIMCDSYVEGCKYEGTEAEITMSVLDLSKIWPLLEAYDAMGKEALTTAVEQPTFFSEFGRSALASENYGGNTREQGFSNMVDLGCLAANSQDILPESTPAVLEALEDCVVYKINGDYRQDATGVSCYYSYNGDYSNYMDFASMGYSEPFKYLYDYRIEGKLSDEAKTYLSIDDAPDIENIIYDIDMLQDYELYVDDEGCATLDIGGDIAEMLTSVYFNLYYVDEESDFMMCLGRDNDIVGDWDTGVFKDNFRGVWGSIDDSFVYMDLSLEGDGYNVYAVPIYLNGEECYLNVAYDFNEEEWIILGARYSWDDDVVDKELMLLEEGDEVIPILYTASITGGDDFVAIEGTAITVTADTAFAERDMGDGFFVMNFEMTDMQGNVAYSELATFKVEGDDIITEIGW